jgi:hypothetical protein
MALPLQTAPQPILHLRFQGRSIELPLAELDLTLDAPDAQILRALTCYLGRPAGSLDGMVVVRHQHAIVVRPEAIYG